MYRSRITRRSARAVVSLAAVLGLGAAAVAPATAGPGDDDGVGWYNGRWDTFSVAHGTDWRALDPDTAIYVSGGSGPGGPGPMVVRSPVPQAPRVLSPETWAVDSSAAYGGGIDVTALMWTHDVPVPYLRLQLTGDDGTVLTTDVDNPNPDDELAYYHDFEARLVPGVWQDAEGQPATAEQLHAVLDGFEGLTITMPTGGEPEFSDDYEAWIDRVVLAGPVGTVFPELRMHARTRHGTPELSGRLFGQADCTVNQRVRIVRVDEGGAEQVVARTFTGEGRRFSVPQRRLGPGIYRADVPTRKRFDWTCAAAISRSVTLPQG